MQALALEACFIDLLLELLRVLGGTPLDRDAIGRRLRSEVERIRAADRMLVERMDHPPTLVDLVRSMGLGESTLKRGFKQVCGTTVFEWLRRLRMERARTALETGASTVLEAATLVGYSNPSHFASAFQHQFGTNPKRFQLDGAGRILAGPGGNPALRPARLVPMRRSLSRSPLRGVLFAAVFTAVAVGSGVVLSLAAQEAAAAGVPRLPPVLVTDRTEHGTEVAVDAARIAEVRRWT
jgi:AraC-like DNA-binding protein